MHSHSQSFLRAAKHLEDGYRLPQATARRVAELAGFHSDRDLTDNWISLGHAVEGLLQSIAEQSPMSLNAAIASQEVSQ